MLLHHAWSLARTYCGRAWIVTMVMNIAILIIKWKDLKRSSAQARVSFQGMRVFNCNWIWKIKYFRFFSVSLCTTSSLELLQPFHYYYLSFFIFLIFSCQTRLSSSVRPPGLGHGTRPQQQPIRSVPDQTTTPDNRGCLRCDHRSDDAPTPTPDHCLTRPAHQNQPIRSDHYRHTRPADHIGLTEYHPWLLHFKSAQHTQLREMVQVMCIDLPCPFSEVGFLCRCSISDIISALRFSLASRKRFGFVFLHLFQMD